MMYQQHGWWFPDEDTHFAEMLDKNIAKGNAPVYQKPVRDRSLGFVQEFGVALDIGANVGLWSRDLCGKFQSVIAFEPVPQFRECLKKNVPAENIDVRACALGEQDTMIDMVVTEGNTGHSHVDTASTGAGSIPMYRLDSLEFDRIDYCKIDCEGYELIILRGGEKTFRQHRPIMVVEQKLHKDTGITEDTQFGAVDLLKSWGARELARVNHDVILGW
jgi:FkbM family methyltransferase